MELVARNVEFSNHLTADAMFVFPLLSGLQ